MSVNANELAGLSVSASGIALSGLLLQTTHDSHSKGYGRVGLIHGAFSTEEFKVKASDSRHQEMRLSKSSAAIHHFQVLPNDTLLKSDGSLDKTLLSESNLGTVIGWYRIRHGMPLRPTLHEYQTHLVLAEFFGATQKENLHTSFLYALSSEVSNEELQSKSVDYRFMTFDADIKSFKYIRLEIQNLSQSAVAHQENFSAFIPPTHLSGLSVLGKTMTQHIEEAKEAALLSARRMDGVLDSAFSVMKNLISEEESLCAEEAKLLKLLQELKQ